MEREREEGEEKTRGAEARWEGVRVDMQVQERCDIHERNTYK